VVGAKSIDINIIFIKMESPTNRAINVIETNIQGKSIFRISVDEQDNYIFQLALNLTLDPDNESYRILLNALIFKKLIPFKGLEESEFAILLENERIRIREGLRIAKEFGENLNELSYSKVLQIYFKHSKIDPEEFN